MPSSLLSAFITIFGCACLRRPTGLPANSGRDSQSPTVACSSLSTAPSRKDIDGQARQSTSFADLPPELVIQIFKEVDSFSTAWTLGKTSRQLEHIFILNSHAILRDVAFHSPQAQQLASAQELATLPQQPLSQHPSTAQNRSHRMLSAAKSALRALSHYEVCVFNYFTQNGHEHLSHHPITPAEQIAFLQAYYRTMTLVTQGQPKIPFESLARLDMLEYLQMREITMLLTPSQQWQDEIDLGITFPQVYSQEHGRCKHGFTSPFAPVTFPIDETLTPVVNWEETLLSLSCIEGCLLQNEACHGFHPGGPKPFWYFILFRGYQEEFRGSVIEYHTRTRSPHNYEWYFTGLLIIQIFKSSDSLADLTSLGSASRKLFVLWRANKDAICEAVLPRAVPCYEQVQELLAVQGKAQGDEHSVFGHRSAADRHKRILKEAATAAEALVYFEKSIRKLWAANIFPVEQAVLTSAERTDFIRAYHRAMILATPREKMSRTQLPSSWSMLDLRQVTDVMKWWGLYCSGGQQRDLGVCFDYQYSHQKVAGLISGERW